jgi:hypothetical protein
MRYLTLLSLLLILLAPPAAAMQEDERKLWDTLPKKSPAGPAKEAAKPAAKVARRTYRQATPQIPAESVTPDSVVGVTLWRLKPVDDSAREGERLLIQEGGNQQSFLPERIEGETPIASGQRLRLSIEAARRGYVYVIDREEYADGTLGDPYLIFPTLRTRRGNNAVGPGQVLEIPAQSDAPPYFTLRPSRDDQVSEIVYVLVTSEPLELAIGRNALKLDREEVAAWLQKWGREVGRLELEGGSGQAYTKEEKEAGEGARSLRHEEPRPQSLYYRPGAKPGEPVLVTVPLRFVRASPK